MTAGSAMDIVSVTSSSTALTAREALHGAENVAQIHSALHSTLYGKTEALQLVIAALLAEQHVLIIDPSGVGKTTMVKSLADTLSAEFAAMIFPSPSSNEEISHLLAGANFILLDDIDQATTAQQVIIRSVLSQDHPLNQRPFLTVAHCSCDHLQVAPLPAQLVDHFGIAISIGYPDFADEAAILRNSSPTGLRRTVVQDVADVDSLIIAAARVHVAPALDDYIVRLVTGTRSHSSLWRGASVRASLSLRRMTQAWALCAGRHFVIPEDIQCLLGVVLAHRLSTVAAPESGNYEAPAIYDVLDEILGEVPVPALDRLTITELAG